MNGLAAPVLGPVKLGIMCRFMSRRIKLALAVIATLLVGAAIFVAVAILPTATAFAAKIYCSATFVTGIEAERGREQDLGNLAWLGGGLGVDVDHENKIVHTSFLGVANRSAMFREGVGCTMMQGRTPEAMQAQVPSLPPALDFSTQPWPTGGQVPPGQSVPGLNHQELAAAVDGMFAESDPEKPLWTRAVVVVYDDKLIAERYAPGITKETKLLGWSMTKSVTATLLGVLVGQNHLDVHAKAPIAAWQGEGDPRSEITIDQLMRMSSGLAFEEVYGPMSDATTMLYQVPDAAAMAIDKPLVGPPDSVWSYSSGTTNILAKIIRDTVEANYGEHANWGFPRTHLFDVIGMTHTLCEPDPSGTLIGSSSCYASGRDWARFGLLHLHDGVWKGERVLPKGWVDYVRTPTAGSPEANYGAQWWTNVGRPEGSPDRRFPSLPTDTFQASGFQGQSVMVIPSRKLVVVRLGMTHDRSVLDLDGSVAKIIAALPASGS